MTDSEIQKLVERLPEVQRDIARRKIYQAQALGWVNIDLVTPDGEVGHHYDLMGLHPITQRMQCIPELSEVKD